MASVTTTDQLLLTATPDLPWPAGQPSRVMNAVVMRSDYGYNDSTSGVPLSLRGRLKKYPELLQGGRLMLYTGEPGYLFSRENKSNRAMVVFVKGAKLIVAVLPTSVLIEGKLFRNLAQQTADTFIATTTPTLSIRTQQNDTAFQKFVRSFWSTLANQPAQLRSLGLNQSDIDECFRGTHLVEHVDSILSAVLPQVRQVLMNVNFSLRDLLNLRHVSADWPGTRACVYLRIYTHPQGQQPMSYRDAAQSDINEHVGLYVGQARNPWQRHITHEQLTSGQSLESHGHYTTARKSSAEHRHMIPLLVFQQPDISNVRLNMAEQTMLLALGSCDRALYAPISEGVNAHWQLMQRRAQLMASVASPVRRQVGWPSLKPKGCNRGSPLFELRFRPIVHCIPMAPGDRKSTRTFTTYRVQRSWRTLGDYEGVPTQGVVLNSRDSETHQHVIHTIALWPQQRDMASPKPQDTKSGYLVAEIMDDGHAHPRAWVGVPTVGPFKEFDRASSLALRFEWFDKARQKWYTIPLQRRAIGRSTAKELVAAGDFEGLLEPWRVAMNMIQAFEGTVYTGPLDGFHRGINFGDILLLETDHLNQTYRLVPKKVSRPVPARASFEENFNHMHRLFDTDLTHVGPSQPLGFHDDVMNRAKGDKRHGFKEGQKCDTCNYMGKGVNCTRDESRQDVWVCKCCSLLNRPCTFTAWSEAKPLWGTTPPLPVNDPTLSVFPTGPHRFMSFHYTMNPDQLCEVREVPQPLFDKLGMEEEVAEEGEEVLGDVGDV